MIVVVKCDWCWGEVSETVMINGGVIVTCMRGNDVINTCIDTDDVS